MWNSRRISLGYAATTLCLCLVAFVGTWLSWVTPKVVYVDGEPTIIAIGLWGRRTGYHTGDGFVLLSVLLAVLAAFAFGRRKWLRDALVFLPGAAVSLWVGNALYGYWTTERYLLGPGIFLVVGSGVLLCLLSASAVLKRSTATESAH